MLQSYNVRSIIEYNAKVIDSRFIQRATAATRLLPIEKAFKTDPLSISAAYTNYDILYQSNPIIQLTPIAF